MITYDNFKSKQLEIDYKVTKDMRFISTQNMPENKIELLVGGKKKNIMLPKIQTT